MIKYAKQRPQKKMHSFVDIVPTEWEILKYIKSLQKTKNAFKCYVLVEGGIFSLLDEKCVVQEESSIYCTIYPDWSDFLVARHCTSWEYFFDQFIQKDLFTKEPFIHKTHYINHTMRPVLCNQDCIFCFCIILHNPVFLSTAFNSDCKIITQLKQHFLLLQHCRFSWKRRMQVINRIETEKESVLNSQP